MYCLCGGSGGGGSGGGGRVDPLLLIHSLCLKLGFWELELGGGRGLRLFFLKRSVVFVSYTRRNMSGSKEKTK
jgi:hypothetical protein